MTSATTTAEHLRKLARRLPLDATVSGDEAAALRHAAAIVDFVAAHAAGLRLLANRLRPDVAAVAQPGTDAALAALPEVRSVLEAFPGSVIESVADLAPIPVPETAP